ncbi:hypothetical protein PJK55_14730 [Exiguobacterium sp. MMG028]|uniref:hypothetical protein n=1 Tax=Exiguobacterium sp. MMG028 TaxID=3021979 RepID=UPI0022FE9492|nr:hypothetical protein [Exiguobacterium sp. MMG028]MDA5561992.1 hypothetical protein [Exiguobacterium sp. MMG028]
MNLDKFEKIDGREALRRFADGEVVYGRDSGSWTLNENDKVIYHSKFGTSTAGVTLNDFIKNKNLYVKKPFDVRQAMLDRPNEWVGAFKQGEYWFKVGFDRTEYCAVLTALTYDVKVDVSLDKVHTVCSDRFEKCIPIEDVPEEATR